MRKIVVYELLSLDGVAQDPDTFFTTWDDEMEANLAAVIATQDAVILGRRTYDEWARVLAGQRQSSRSRISSTGLRSTSRPRRRSTGSGPTRPPSTAAWSNSWSI